MSDLQIQGQVATQDAKTVGRATKPAPQESVGKAYAKGLWEGFKGYYAEQYEGIKDQAIFKGLCTAAKGITVGAGYGLYKILTAKTDE